MNNYTLKEKSRMLIDETIDMLRDKSFESTLIDRLFRSEEASDRYTSLPQPLALGYCLEYVLENVEVPVSEHDILMGRFQESVPTEEENKRLDVIRQKFNDRKLFMCDGGHITLDWETMLERGISGYIHLAESELERRTANGDPSEQLIFLEGLIHVYRAHRRYFIRYAEAARAAGLTQAADACANIADNPPKTFFEAIQFLLLVMNIYSLYAAFVNATLVYGRVDDLLAPYYERDVAAGILTREDAGYIIDDFNCKSAMVLGRGEHQMSGGSANETGWFRNPMYDSPTYAIIGGYSNNRDYKTNPLTLLFAERIHPRFENPVYVFRRTKDDDPQVWDVICDKLRLNSTLLIYNDETVIPAFENAAIEPYDAKNYTIHGCNWPDIAGLYVNVRQYGGPIPRLIFEAMFDEDGKTKRDFKSMDDVYEAITDLWTERVREAFSWYRSQYVNNEMRLPTSLNVTEAFTRGVLEAANLRANGGTKYIVMYGLLRNIGTAADMLSGLDTVVFGDDPVPLDVMCAALKANFEGYEALHKRMKSAPKFGQDNDIADGHAVRLMTMLEDIIDRESINENGVRDVHSFNVTITDMWHVREGSLLGAGPDGRVSGAPLSENLSPSEGATDSVTALLNSVSKLPFERITAGALNVRMPKNLTSGDEGLMRLKILLDTYFENGGMQLQLSVADTAELRDAQKHPEKYRDLMVRITGYSAVFVDMCEKAQNEIIRRDEVN